MPEVKESKSPSGLYEQLTKEKTAKSNAIQIPEISLPKGGGALKGIDEQFQVNPANGTSSFSIPLPVSPARSGSSPDLALSYNSGSGNSPYGLGWSVSYPVIQRKMDRLLPRYLSGELEDVFTLSGAEDLVAYLDEDGENWKVRESQVGDLTILRYRPRQEGSFSRIERITQLNKIPYWKVTGGDNTVILFGLDDDSRIQNPEDPNQVYAWLPSFSYDDKGNWIRYVYKRENFDNLASELHERNRLNGLAAITNQYLKRVVYGNRKPWFASDPYQPTLPPNDAECFFELVMDYGEHDADVPTPQEVQVWSSRPDAFSFYRAGFEIRTYRRCHRILMFHHFEELGSEPCLVRSLDLTYSPSSINGSGQTEVSYLSQLTSRGYVRRQDETYSTKALPPMIFDYQSVNWNTEVRTVDADSCMNAPVGLGGDYVWTDLYGEGISGILSEQAEGLYYKSNFGDIDGSSGVKLSPASQVSPKPSFRGLHQGAVALQDLEADGEKQLVVNQPGIQGYFEMTEDNDFKSFQAFQTVANIGLSAAHARILDLNGDGRADLVVTEDNVFVWYASEGKKGYKAAERSLKTFDEELGPSVIFADLSDQESIVLADMSGDGLTDIVRVRNGEICYWPNKGYGKFGAKVSMSNAPIFDCSDAFDPEKVLFTDISGTGATDIVYLGQQSFKAYVNLSGNAWSESQEIDPFLPIHSNSQVSVVDLLGTGTSCIVWSSNLASDSQRPMHYIDLMDSRKPHVMTRYANNLGKEVYLEYRSSTHDYLKDKREGKPWITKLPFPVQVVSKVTVEEHITAVSFSTNYRYHHGYYDHAEKEFRGFGMVEQLDTELYRTWSASSSGTKLEQTEELYQAPVLTKTWFHTGAFLDRERILNHYEKEYWYEAYQRLFPESSVVVNEPQLEDARVVAAENLEDQAIIEYLSADEWREALRACRGMILRQEIFALDGKETDHDSLMLQAKPYSVATHNCDIQLLQPRAGNKHAVFMTTEREAIGISYERNEVDPRVTHLLNTRMDELGQILEAVSVVYPRRIVDPYLPQDIQAKQAQTFMTCVRHQYTNDITQPETYRLRLVAETETFELTGILPSGDLYQLGDFQKALEEFNSTTNPVGTSEIAYRDQASTGRERRLIEHTRTLFYNEDLTHALPLYQLPTHGLGYESYQLAYTPDLLLDLFGTKVIDQNTLMNEGRYIEMEGNWWVRSGITQLVDTSNGESRFDAESRFFTPLSYTDPFGSKTTVNYFKDYFLLMESTVDALGNEITAENFNFRVLSPTRMRDANDNLSEVILDELGLVKATALMGKGQEADNLSGLSEATEQAEHDLIKHYFTLKDTTLLRTTARQLLKNATTRFVYDFDRYQTSLKLREEQINPGPCEVVKYLPSVVGGIIREEHHVTNPNSPLQLGFEYSDGMGQVAMVKTQAEPGEALSLNIYPDCSYSVETIDTNNDLRWLGNGRTVFNNKGNPVKQFEPYFSVNPFFEDAKELVERGVTPVIYYDALGRNIRTELPDGTFTKVEFDSWQQRIYDSNDTVRDSQWYLDRGSPDPADPSYNHLSTDPQVVAAWKAAQYDDTPLQLHLDSQGRPVYSVEHNRVQGQDTFYATRIELDIEGNTLAVIDARGNSVMQYGYNFLGYRVYQNSMDAGERWMLVNAVGSLLRAWDGRGHILSNTFDVLQRPLEMRVEGGDQAQPLNHVFQKLVYGESMPNAKNLNMRGQVQALYDTAGKISSISFDFKGNLLEGNRRFASGYRQTADWSGLDPDNLLEAETFISKVSYDALNRPIFIETSDGSIYIHSFNEASMLDSISVNMETPNGLSRIEENCVKKISYDEKGRRKSILYGNSTRSDYIYDPKSFRLVRSQSKGMNQELLQDFIYQYDAVGNITEIQDSAAPTVFFGNMVSQARSLYTYDGLNRLVEAKGREHVAQNTLGSEDHWHDLPFLKRYQAGDSMAMRPYTQSYQYDSVGNLLQMQHVAQGGNWTRDYNYESANNRLKSTQVGQQIYHYPYHAQHGNMIAMPHLPSMQWNFLDQLLSTSRQADSSISETTWYVYDAGGERVRKITENQGGNSLKEERLYLGGLEIYRKHSGQHAGLERRSLHISDTAGRVAMVDTRNEIDDDTGQRTIRYQMGNHLGSVSLETNESAQVISYEEYHPFGTTAYQAVNASIKVAAKRYRYTGMERDEESGLSYHSARYYIPWLGRWTIYDPMGLVDGLNIFAYSSNNPIALSDPSGQQSQAPEQKGLVNVVPGTTFTGKESVEQLHTAARASGYDFTGEPTWDGSGWHVGKVFRISPRETILAQVKQMTDPLNMGDSVQGGFGESWPILPQPGNGAGDDKNSDRQLPSMLPPFSTSNNTGPLGSLVHARVLPELTERLFKHGIISHFEIRIPGASKSGSGNPGRVDFDVYPPTEPGIHRYELKPHNPYEFENYAGEIDWYNDFPNPGDPLGWLPAQRGTYLADHVKPEHPDVFDPIKTTIGGHQVSIHLYLPEPGLITYTVHYSGGHPVGVPVEIRERGKEPRFIDPTWYDKFFLIDGEANIEFVLRTTVEVELTLATGGAFRALKGIGFLGRMSGLGRFVPAL
ncbi:MAG: SpvB/TcaC N-terminal domain-containing protein [Verrucomicrobiota bacterium]